MNNTITLKMVTSEGSITKTYRTLSGARRAAHRFIGPTFSIDPVLNHAVNSVGDYLHVSGIGIKALRLEVEG